MALKNLLCDIPNLLCDIANFSDVMLFRKIIFIVFLCTTLVSPAFGKKYYYKSSFNGNLTVVAPCERAEEESVYCNTPPPDCLDDDLDDESVIICKDTREPSFYCQSCKKNIPEICTDEPKKTCPPPRETCIGEKKRKRCTPEPRRCTIDPNAIREQQRREMECRRLRKVKCMNKKPPAPKKCLIRKQIYKCEDACEPEPPICDKKRPKQKFKYECEEDCRD